MTSIPAFWTVVGILLGALVIAPSVMGLFRKNQFDVAGKVCFVRVMVYQYIF